MSAFEVSGGVTVANGVAGCDISAATCALLLRDDTQLARPIGITAAP